MAWPAFNTNRTAQAPNDPVDHGEAKTVSRTSTEDISSGRRGGLRSHSGPGGRTRDQLYEEARRRNVKGRSKMTKAQLEHAVDR